MPLLYREAPLNSVWEGSGNVNALDVLRALGREPEALDAWITEVGRARGGDARLDRAIEDTLALLGSLMGDPAAMEVNARRLAGRMAAVPAGLAAGALRPRRGGRRRSARPGSARRTTASSARSTAATCGAIVERATPPSADQPRTAVPVARRARRHA